MISQTIDCWALAAWCGINLVIPVAAPLLVLWLFGRPRTTAAMAGRNVLKSIGKGELFWAAMGMSAATCYELYSLQKILVDQNGIGLAWVGFWIHLFVILFSVIYVGIGSLSAAVVGAANPHIPDPNVFRASITTLVFTIISYTAVHTVLMSEETGRKLEVEQAARREKAATIDRMKTCLTQRRTSARDCLENIK